MTCDMEEFLESRFTSYLDLAGLDRDKLKHVATPFLAEDHTKSPAGAPQKDDNHTGCPWCKAAEKLGQKCLPCSGELDCSQSDIENIRNLARNIDAAIAAAAPNNGSQGGILTPLEMSMTTKTSSQ